MNIAIFTDAYLPVKNGVVTSINQLKRGLEKEGHRVYIFTVSVPDAEYGEDIYTFPGIPIGKGSEGRLGVIYQQRINKLMKKLEIDIIHTHSEWTMGLGGRSAAKKLNIPIVHTHHTLWADYTHYIFNGKLFTPQVIYAIFRNYLSSIKYLIFPSRKPYTFYYPMADKGTPYRFIPNGVDNLSFNTDPMAPEERLAKRRELGIQDDEKVAIFVGRIGPEKRVSELYFQMTRLFKTHAHIKMICVGDGPALREIREKAKKDGYGDRVIFTGFIAWSQVSTYYSLSDAFVTLSLSEVHPMTLIEAAIAGLPAVVRKDESYVPLVEEGTNGYLLEDDRMLPEKLSYLFAAENSGVLAEFSRQSLERSKLYTADNHVAAVKQFYEWILEDYPKRYAKKKRWYKATGRLDDSMEVKFD